MIENKKKIIKIHINKALEAFRKDPINVEDVTHNLEQAITHLEDLGE